jgi:hypothetical protein
MRLMILTSKPCSSPVVGARPSWKTGSPSAGFSQRGEHFGAKFRIAFGQLDAADRPEVDGRAGRQFMPGHHVIPFLIR